jgi:hypothetical protein
MGRSHYVGLVPVTGANYVQRRLKWDKPESDYSEQRKRELAEDAQREPLSGDHVVGRPLSEEVRALLDVNAARHEASIENALKLDLVEKLQAAERELQAKEEELCAEASTRRRSGPRSSAKHNILQVLEAMSPEDLDSLTREALIEKVQAKIDAECGGVGRARSTIQPILADFLESRRRQAT